MFIKRKKKKMISIPTTTFSFIEFRKLFPVKDDNTSGNFFIKENGRNLLQLSLLLCYLLNFQMLFLQ